MFTYTTNHRATNKTSRGGSRTQSDTRQAQCPSLTKRIKMRTKVQLMLTILVVSSAHNALIASSQQETPETSTTPAEALPTTTTPTSTSSTPPPPTTTTAEKLTSSIVTTTIPITTTTTPNEPASTSKPKIAPVNFALVDKLFDDRLNITEMVAKWRALDKQLVTGIGDILKFIFPQVVAMSSEAKVSGQCSGAILKWILNLRNLKTWAVHMLDASGKPGPGILEGQLSMLGNFAQCLNIQAPDEDEIELADGEFREYFRGQYCVLQIRPHISEKPRYYSLNSTVDALKRINVKSYERTVYDDLSELVLAFNFVHIRADLCVPSLCSRDDIQRVADFLARKLDVRAKVARCNIKPMNGIRLADKQQVTWMIGMSLFILLVILSTLAHWTNQYQFDIAGEKSLQFGSISSCMSLGKSWTELTSVNLSATNQRRPVMLQALKLSLLAWILLVNLISQLDLQFLRQMLPLRDLIIQLPMQVVVNSSLAFDGLILISAFMYAYENVNSTILDLVKYNIGKYARMLAVILFLSGLTILLPLIGQIHPSSPVWNDFVDEPARQCRDNWLNNLLFIQNWLPIEGICLEQSWLFCVELQLSFLSIPLLYLMNRQFDKMHGKFKLLSLPNLFIILIILPLGCILNWINIYSNQLPPAWFLTFPDKQDKLEYEELHLFRTTSHLIPFALGLLLGHLCRCHSISSFEGRPYGRGTCHTLMVSTSFILMLALIFGTHSWSLSGRAHLDWPYASATYASLAPLAWSIALSLLLHKLAVPSWADKADEAAGSLGSIMSSIGPSIIRLARLSFLCFMVNPFINRLVLALQETAIFSSSIMLLHTFIGNLVLTLLMSLILCALVELPARRLVKKLLLGSSSHSTNLGIISRQLDLQQREMVAHGHGHESFVGPPPPGPTTQPSSALSSTLALTHRH